jgi:diguanylate cyclase (GGDEF)-like protein/PAS domain S-box-containing protein
MEQPREVLLQATFDNLQEGVWVVDASSRTIVFSNLVAARLVGMARETLVGVSVERFAATPQDQCFWSGETQDLAGGIESQTSLLRADGQLVLVERRVAPFLLAAAGSALLVTMTDCSARQSAERELETLLSELRATLDSAADGMLVCGLDGRVRAFNQRLAQIWEIPQELLLYRNDAALHAFFASRVRDPEFYRDRLESIALDPGVGQRDVLELQDGKLIERRSVPQRSQGSVIGQVFSFRDITEEVHAQAALRLAGRVYEASPYPIFIADARHRFVQLNPAAEQLVGQPAAALLGTEVTTLFGMGVARHFMECVQQDWAHSGIWNGEIWLPRDGENGCAIHLSWVALRGDGGVLEQSIGFVRDLTQQHAAQKRIDELAFSDVLTGLPNRLLLSQRVETAIRTARPGETGFAILFLDLDRFKLINDSLGHHFGDRVLQLVATRLQTCMRQSDMLCRIGGDEFAMYLHAGDVKVAEHVARRMLDVMRQPFTLDDMGFSIQCSIGVALYPQDGTSLDELIKQADTAMYQVKERGRGNYGFYKPQMSTHLLERMQMEHSLRQALDGQHMRVHFQPQVDMATGHIVGAEALLRWTDPQWGAVSPGVFIPLAEETGYIVTLGAWVLEQSVMQAVQWMQAGTSLTVSVNISALEMRQPDFVERLTRLLHESGLPAHLLELELTESILLQDAQEAAQRLEKVAALGVTLAIDDFGTGYSSLAYLKNLPIHKLKIDQSFVRGLPDDEGDRSIVSAIVHLGKALHLCVVAEGVETPAQCAALLAMQCDQYQGFLCSAALPAADFAVLLTDETLGPC